MRTDNKQELIKEVKKLNQEEKYQEVFTLLTDDILDKHNNSELYAEIAEARYRLKKDNYEDYGQKSLNINPNVKALIYLGHYYFHNEDLNKAKEKYDEAFNIDSELPEVYVAIANVFFHQKDFLQSEKYYKISLEKDKDHYKGYIGLGNIYAEKNDFENAEKYFKKAIEIFPNSTNTNYNLGNIYLRKGNYSKAEIYYKKVLEADDQFINVYNNFGIVNYKKKEYEEAEKNYKKAIELNPDFIKPYHNIGNLYFAQERYKEAKEAYKKYVELKEDIDFLYELANGRITEINKILANEDYEKIQEIVTKIKETLQYRDKCITHFTSLSVAKLLVFKCSKFRLSEGAYLNDTSEGRELFSFLNYQSPFGRKENPVDEIFVRKPFIGSFVSEYKHNDLTMWRMYGKEGKDEAKGCAITMDVKNLTEQIHEKLGINKLEENELEIKFCKVAYWKDDKFIIPDEKISSTKIKNLNKYCNNLKKALQEFNIKDEEIKIQIDIEELLFEIAFLFKGVEYQYEHEIRLVQKGIGFDKIIDKEIIIPRVYIELGDISKSIKKITLGPKVERADEWASAFHYELENKEIKAEIHISRQPFK